MGFNVLKQVVVLKWRMRSSRELNDLFNGLHKRNMIRSSRFMGLEHVEQREATQLIKMYRGNIVAKKRRKRLKKT